MDQYKKDLSEEVTRKVGKLKGDGWANSFDN
jgi:hypothetical protein